MGCSNIRDRNTNPIGMRRASETPGPRPSSLAAGWLRLALPMVDGIAAVPAADPRLRDRNSPGADLPSTTPAAGAPRRLLGLNLHLRVQPGAFRGGAGRGSYLRLRSITVVLGCDFAYLIDTYRPVIALRARPEDLRPAIGITSSRGSRYINYMRSQARPERRSNRIGLPPDPKPLALWE